MTLVFHPVPRPPKHPEGRKLRKPLSRGKPPTSRKPLPRNSAPKKVNRARRSAAFVRCFGSDERVEWIQGQGCCVCGTRPSENAHAIGGGAGRRADAASVVPLCQAHHRELHRAGAETFRRHHLIELETIAGEFDKLWLAQGGEA